jgi:hypothetical protein
VTDTNVFQLCQPGSFADPLTEVLRNGASAADAGRRGRGCSLAQLSCRQADRALEASAHDERHRKFVRHGAPLHRALHRRSFKQNALAMIFKLAEAAEKSWRRLDGHNQFA